MSEETKKSITIFKTPSWGILGMAFLIMLSAKCFGYAPDLSWWIITAPFWGPFAFCIGFFAFFYMVMFFAAGVLGLALMAMAVVEVVRNKFKSKKGN